MQNRRSIDSITRFIFCSDKPREVDLAIVLGSPSISNVEPAISLYLEALAPRILITGHGRRGVDVPEWQVYRDHAVSQGVAEEDILIEPDATNTYENFLFSECIIARELGWDRVSSLAICCKPLHARRAFMTARQILPSGVNIVVLPPRHPADIQADNWWLSSHGKERVMGEMRRIAEYSLKGDISIE